MQTGAGLAISEQDEREGLSIFEFARTVRTKLSRATWEKPKYVSATCFTMNGQLGRSSLNIFACYDDDETEAWGLVIDQCEIVASGASIDDAIKEVVDEMKSVRRDVNDALRCLPK